MVYGDFGDFGWRENKPNSKPIRRPLAGNPKFEFRNPKQVERGLCEKTKPILGKGKSKKAKMRVNPVFIRNTIFQLLVFCACFQERPTITFLFVIRYETFFKEELLAFCFSP